jgi:hypothetical protein
MCSSDYIRSSCLLYIREVITHTPSHSFLKAVVDGSTTNVSRRLLRNYEGYLRATVQEARDRETRSIAHTVEEYLALRRYTGAIIPSFDMILLPLDIPDSVLADPRINELEMIAAEMVCVANVSLQPLGVIHVLTQTCHL